MEVSDDGHGIAAEDIEMIGKRHHTSKITLHEEIFKVRSFGFRGEALHSLTILSGEVVVTSKTQSQPTGTQVTFTNCAVKTATIACNKGTTVRIRGLLQNLPVRLAEWKRNSKRHFSHCVWLLQSYILAVTDVRFRCTNVSTTTTQTLFVSSGSGDTSKSYAEAFKGELKQKLLDVAVETARFGGKLYYCLSGRKSNDRQFCFMNQRPCDLPKVLKKLNEVCKSYAIEGAAILVLYITSNGLIDTNLTPDKRQVAITFEAELVDCICSAFASKLSAGREIERPQTLAAPPPRSLPAGVQEATSVSTYIPPLPYSLEGSSQGPVAACSEISLELSSSSEPVTIPHACTHFDVTLETQNNRILDRGDFEKMKILGQFNCGFILTSIRQGDDKNLVFIIDQHASDERYRLEKLQRELTFNVQTMFIPRRLYLGLEDQLYVSSNLERVKSQGFLVAIVETSELDERIFHLLSAPTVVGIQCNDKGIVAARRACLLYTCARLWGND